MRHANYWVTLNLYAQAITQSKREAQSRVINLFVRGKREKHEIPDPYWNIALCIRHRKPLILLASPTGFEPVLPP
jgi:hypothetical protein